MRISRLLTSLSLPLAALALTATIVSCCGNGHPHDLTPPLSAQTPTWSQADMAFYLHGSMSTEIVPETVLRAFFTTYPDLFPTQDFSHLGALPDPAFGWPVGFSRAQPAHLASLPSVGINCAACHTSDIHAPGQPTVRVLGSGATFDVESFFGSIIAATFRTQDPANMKKFLAAYLNQATPEADPAKAAARRTQFNAALQNQSAQITSAIAADAAGSKNAGPGGLQSLTPTDLQVSPTADLPLLSTNLLKLFHNIRTALHTPDQPPEKLPPASGPGRNDPFGLLAATLVNSPQPYAAVKFGIVWNVAQRRWVHWDGNTPSPIARNILATLGLGAPLVGTHGNFNLALVQHHTDLTEQIAPPKYPYPIDTAAAQRGKPLFESSCITCHDGTYGDNRLYSPDLVKTDPTRAQLFTPSQAAGFNRFLSTLQTEGYTPPATGLRSTGKYYAPSLAGVWARSPYLHNGAVRTIADLLTPPASRPATYRRGSSTYDPVTLGFTAEGPYTLDTKSPGNSNAGHDYGTTLSPQQKHDLIEYLKTL